MTKTTPRATSVLVLVLLLVNGAAVWGQAGWALENIVPAAWTAVAGLSLALAFAAAIELIGVFLAMMADAGEDAGLPSGGVRLGSYSVGLVSGALNFSHWYASGAAAAIAFGFLSAVSPFLWGIWSRVRRGQMSAPSRRFWHPLRSIGLIRQMAWDGVSDENVAVRSLTAATDGHADLRAEIADYRAATDMPDLNMSGQWPERVRDFMAADTEPMTARPDGELSAWEAGYERALSELGQEVATEAEAYVRTQGVDNAVDDRTWLDDGHGHEAADCPDMTADKPLPQRVRTSAGSIPDAVMSAVTSLTEAARHSGSVRAQLVRTVAAEHGVSERTARRWVSAAIVSASGE